MRCSYVFGQELKSFLFPGVVPQFWIQTARPPANRKQHKWQRFRNIQTGEISFRIVRFPDKIIRFRAKPTLIVKGPGPPPPLSPEIINRGEELEQLLAGLGFPDVSGLDLGSLLYAADGNLDRLLSRLRTLVREERKFIHFDLLGDKVRQLYWIRK
jgi:hypothetical protein